MSVDGGSPRPSELTKRSGRGSRPSTSCSGRPAWRSARSSAADSNAQLRHRRAELPLRRLRPLLDGAEVVAEALRASTRPRAAAWAPWGRGSSSSGMTPTSSPSPSLAGALDGGSGSSARTMSFAIWAVSPLVKVRSSRRPLGGPPAAAIGIRSLSCAYDRRGRRNSSLMARRAARRPVPARHRRVGDDLRARL